MAAFEYIEHAPPWARGGLDAHRDSPAGLGFEPAYAPRLPTRIVPRDGTNSISALTLSDAVAATQKILNFSCQEYVHGVSFEFSDARSIEAGVLDLAKLHIEPFEEGSFVIPGALREESVEIDVQGERKAFDGSGVLKRFTEIMHGVTTQGARFPTCVGVLQAIEELGKVLKREASHIEYKPIGFAGYSHRPMNIRVDKVFIDKVTESRRLRQNPRSSQDIINGTLVAVDLSKSALVLKLSGKQTIKGSFTAFMEDKVIRGLGQAVEIDGVITYEDDRPTFVNAIEIVLIDDV